MTFGILQAFSHCPFLSKSAHMDAVGIMLQEGFVVKVICSMA